MSISDPAEIFKMRAEDVAPNKKLDEQCTVGRDRYQP